MEAGLADGWLPLLRCWIAGMRDVERLIEVFNQGEMKMDELKLLIEMVAKLPSMALWVLVGFWAYKVICIGSIYGVIRLAIVKTHDWLANPKSKEIRPLIDGLVISGCKDELLNEIKRLRNRGYSSNSEYVHGSDVAWLREAIDEKIAKSK
jgi:hypothetical protein